MLPLAHTNEGEVLPMRTEVCANRPVDEDHMTLRQCCWPLIEGDLGPLCGDREGDADCLQESVRPRTSHHHDDRRIDRTLLGVDSHDASPSGTQTSDHDTFPQHGTLLLRPLHEGRGRRPRISVAALRLVGGHNEVAYLACRLEFLQLL